MLDKVKAALRITSTAFDEDLEQLIEAAQQDLGIAGVITNDDPIVTRAIITYCGMNRINIDESQRSWLKKSYDEQKAQLQTATGYTNWLVCDHA